MIFGAHARAEAEAHRLQHSSCPCRFHCRARERAAILQVDYGVALRYWQTHVQSGQVSAHEREDLAECVATVKESRSND